MDENEAIGGVVDDVGGPGRVRVNAWVPPPPLIPLRLAPAAGVYEVEPNGCLISVFHQSILMQLLDPSHPIYDHLKDRTPTQTWLGPAQAPLRLLFSQDRVGPEVSSVGLPARAFAFSDSGGAAGQELADRARRLLDHRAPGLSLGIVPTLVKGEVEHALTP